MAREGLPDAVLDIRDRTEVYLDGRKADASALKDGMKVKADFQLEGEEAVAVRIDATSNGATGGAGEAGDDKSSRGGSGGAGQELEQAGDEPSGNLNRAYGDVQRQYDDTKDDLKK